MNQIVFLATFIFELLTAAFYYHNKYASGLNKKWVICSFVVVGIVQYLTNLMGKPYLNLIVFFFAYLMIGKLVYKLTWIKSLFHTSLLSGLMMTTEFVATFVLSIFFKMDVNALNNNIFDLVILSVAAKLLYFISTYIVSKISIQEKTIKFEVPQAAPLLVLPIASIFVLSGMDATIKIFSLDNNLLIINSISAILLLYSNILVFAVYEHMIRLHKKNAELMLLSQKNDIDVEHYHTLHKQQEIAGIIIHDIKKHMTAVRDMAADGHNDELVKYIDSVYKTNSFNMLKQYSSNKLVNVIINRFALKFMEHNIDFYCDIRDIDFSFLQDSEITSLLDNLLGNAFNASSIANKKNVELSIKKQNEHFIVFSVINTCGEKPVKRNGQFITKNKTGFHGIGLKSVLNVINNHNGSCEFNYDEKNMTFQALIVINELNI